MKTIKELRFNLPDRLQTVGSKIRYFSKQNIDYDVFLPSKNMNLQRGFVWTLDQKRELIWSIFYGRSIPPLSLINLVNETWQVIDGKQRLSTLIDFYDNKFTIEIEGTEYYFTELPDDYRSEINIFWFPYYVLYEMTENEFSDQFKIDWFKFINFAGTPQDIEHLLLLN